MNKPDNNNAKEFLNRLINDNELAKQAERAYVEALVTIAQKAGFECSMEDMFSAIEEMSLSNSELSDDMLDMVAGGLQPWTNPGSSDLGPSAHQMESKIDFL